MQRIGKEELIEKFMAMLTDHRTVLLEARELINSGCRYSIQAKLRSGDRAGAATELADYFEANHDGDKMMESCTFLEAQAGNASPQLVQLANTIRECVKTLSGVCVCVCVCVHVCVCTFNYNVFTCAHIYSLMYRVSIHKAIIHLCLLFPCRDLLMQLCNTSSTFVQIEY